MRDWSSQKTATWWKEADANYARRMENEPSESYMAKNFTFDSVLEIGSGTGRLINSLKAEKKGALDINPHLLKLVSDNTKKYCADISEPLIPIHRYELVFSFQVMQHLVHDQFVIALENMKKIATKEVWLMEGIVPDFPDGSLTHHKGSFNHHYEKYLDCYQIDQIHGGKIKIYRAKV